MASNDRRDLRRLIAVFARYRISQRAIARHLGVSEARVSAWWHGRAHVPPQHHRALERWACDLESGPPPPAEVALPAAIQRAIARFLEYLTVERRLARATQVVYRRDLHQFFAAWQRQGQAAHLDLVTPEAVRQYLEGRRAEGISVRTIARTLAALRAFDRYLKTEGLRPAPTLADMQTPRAPRPLPRVLSQQAVALLLKQPNRAKPIGLRDLAMLEVLYGSGLRVSELVSLPMSALHLAEGWIKIRGKGGKERSVPMSEPAIATVHAYLGERRAVLRRMRKDSPFVFLSNRGTPMTRQEFWKLLHGYARQAGITKPVSPHTVRHSFATHLLEGGADILSISRLLGHQDLGTTEIYAHVAPAHLREAYQRYHPRA